MYQNIFITQRTSEEQPVVYIWDDQQGLITTSADKFEYAYIRDTTGKSMYTSIHGLKVKKIYNFRRDDPDLFESDVPRETRILTDLYLNSDEVSINHVIGFFDIEVSSVGGFPNLMTADKEILSISFYNSSLRTYVVFVYDPASKIDDKYTAEYSILRFDTEKQLLQAFMLWFTSQKFTILTGWNISGFDIPYLYRRLSVILGIDDANMLSPVGHVKWSERRERYQIAGISALDYLELYKKFTYTARPTYRLGAIGLYEVNMGKIEFDMNLDELYENDIQKFMEYNLQDVRIVVEIDKKMKLIELVRGICHVGHVQYEDYLHSSKFIEGTILTYLHRKGIIAPNKPIDGEEMMEKALEDDDDDVRFTGAYVKDPNPGRYEWVYSLDLQSLYPSIIMSLNISPETKVGKVHNWNLDEHIKKTIVEYEVTIQDQLMKFSYDKFIDFMNRMKFTISSNGILYLNDRKGIIPEILDKWFNERVEYKNLMKKYTSEGNSEQADYYDRRQHVQKIFLNSIYGVLGLPVFRFYDLDNASAVTSTGQDVIKTSAKYLNKKYQTILNTTEDYCIYIDTDSVYFSAIPLLCEETDDGKKEQTISLAREHESALNSFYNVMAKKLFFCDSHRFVIKGETIARTGLWVAKKCYALLKIYDLETNKDISKIVTKGLGTVRSSFPEAFAKFMSTVLENILKNFAKTDIDNEILSFYNNLSNINYSTISKNTSVKDLSKYDDGGTSMLKFKKGAPAQVKAALIYNRFLISKNLDKRYALIRSGDKIKWCFLRKNPYLLDRMAFKGYDDPKEVLSLVENYIDYNEMFNRELFNKLSSFYSAMGWGIVPTKLNQNSSKLFSF